MEATDTATALNRFGLGARPGDSLSADPHEALLAALARPVPDAPAWAAQPGQAELLAAVQALQAAQRLPDPEQRRDAATAQRRVLRGFYDAAVHARLQTALASPEPFTERLVHFWSNHFALSVGEAAITGLAGNFEAEAIRPHVLGRFEDLLLAAERHPAMLLYLNQAQSAGPGSAVALRANARAGTARRGLNENLAREILELHTLGVRSGYTQQDVGELALALTGWTVAGLRPGQDGAQAGFRFDAALHEPGARQVLGRTYADDGLAQGTAILRDLSGAPATAQHLATKLARHFAGDAPPAPLVERLAHAFLRSGGDLPAVYRVLIASPEAWAAQPLKFKTPWEWLVSALRALDRQDLSGTPAAALLDSLGQPVWRPGAPAGWDDTAATWAAPDALVRRVELAQRLAARSAATLDARALAPQVLPGTLGPATRAALARAESPASALALLLVSPDFLRR
ncbi:DUF1800 family protein [Pseudorhodoferax sp. Leaf274]|uniref:DUF1800 domain-containing protein n=1 Tax=Pseudorhodoferax sp. Leaf274 TaxID=1736318 RepID=UPI0007036048|nr:DUF1800 domain-containing protein [Pseudorhodoferax sp. Leaf274]KQP45057.1 hypothetical protein ASF44_26600 [Pseudorhodoferax sp. Leaf274]